MNVFGLEITGAGRKIVLLISLYIYYDQYEKIWRKNPKCFFFPRLVSMEMVAILDFRALTKVHITSKPLLQMQ